MKTSLNLDDHLFKAAQKEMQKTGQTLSATISRWARLGMEQLRRQRPKAAKPFKALDLGGPARIDLSCRRDWRDLL